MTLDINTISGFEELGLSKPLLKAVADAGYATPTPIQAQVIPVFMTGRDVVGQAQTGTGKTAAFALPILEKIDLSCYDPQVLVLAPTRELANQVCESFNQYASHLDGLRTVAVYGGLEYGTQLRAFLRGVHVVVGTPGRVMDHIDRGTLRLGSIKTIILDEADEMLNMGFKEDVEWILERAPKQRQIALFSATMPQEIRELARRFMNDPAEITIRQRTATVEATRQRYWQITGLQKIDALSRLLEAEDYDAALIFVSRKIDTLEVTDQLTMRGFNVAALNGDLPQGQRERIIDQLRNGKLNIVVATDVAARGLDVDRISHVINYDLPQDQESYIHRIGRTGRAGRKGEAIIFISAREKRWLQMLEKTTRQPIEQMQMPTASFICTRRVNALKDELNKLIELGKLDFYKNLIDIYCHESGVEVLDAAAALAKLLSKDKPLQVQEQKNAEAKALKEFEPEVTPKADRRSRKDNEPEEGMKSYRVEVGKFHGVQPANLVGAISGETGMSSRYIGRIRIMDCFSIVDLPEDMPQELIDKLKDVVVCRRPLNISLDKKQASGAAESKPQINIADIDPDDLAANPELARQLGLIPSDKPQVDVSKFLHDFSKESKKPEGWNSEKSEGSKAQKPELSQNVTNKSSHNREDVRQTKEATATSRKSKTDKKAFGKNSFDKKASSTKAFGKNYPDAQSSTFKNFGKSPFDKKANGRNKDMKPQNMPLKRMTKSESRKFRKRH